MSQGKASEREEKRQRGQSCDLLEMYMFILEMDYKVNLKCFIKAPERMLRIPALSALYTLLTL